MKFNFNPGHAHTGRLNSSGLLVDAVYIRYRLPLSFRGIYIALNIHSFSKLAFIVYNLTLKTDSMCT